MIKKGQMRFAHTMDDADECDIGGRGESHSPYKSPQIMKSQSKSRNNASQYIGKFIVIEKIYEETNSKLRIGI